MSAQKGDEIFSSPLYDVLWRVQRLENFLFSSLKRNMIQQRQSKVLEKQESKDIEKLWEEPNK